MKVHFPCACSSALCTFVRLSGLAPAPTHPSVWRDFVKALLGDGVIAPGKAECGPQLEILGIEMEPTAAGFTCRLSTAKAQKSLDAIPEALERGSMYSGCAQKLAVRLSWASQFVFKRLGRAMLRPVYADAHSWCACLTLCRACHVLDYCMVAAAGPTTLARIL